ncbi:MAG TPA: hypothetical protein VMM37_04555 [Bacteroidota bacterium]|nr:hypothetical protein [Bacteroidota bacterium]
MQLEQPNTSLALRDSRQLWNYLARSTNPIKEFSEQLGETRARRARVGLVFSIALISLAAGVELLFLAFLIRALLS